MQNMGTKLSSQYLRFNKWRGRSEEKLAADNNENEADSYSQNEIPKLLEQMDEVMNNHFNLETILKINEHSKMLSKIEQVLQHLCVNQESIHNNKSLSNLAKSIGQNTQFGSPKNSSIRLN